MTWHQGPAQGPSAATSTTRGQAARMASAATTRGAACPRRVSVDKTRQGSLKCSCGHDKTQTRLSWLWCVDGIHGARVSGGRRAWVSGDPAGLIQWRSGGLESAAGQRALSQRRAGGVISRERRAWGSDNSGTREPSRRAWDSHSRWRISPAIGGHEGSLAARDKTQGQNKN